MAMFWLSIRKFLNFNLIGHVTLVLSEAMCENCVCCIVRLQLRKFLGFTFLFYEAYIVLRLRLLCFNIEYLETSYRVMGS